MSLLYMLVFMIKEVFKVKNRLTTLLLFFFFFFCAKNYGRSDDAKRRGKKWMAQQQNRSWKEGKRLRNVQK